MEGARPRLACLARAECLASLGTIGLTSIAEAMACLWVFSPHLPDHLSMPSAEPELLLQTASLGESRVCLGNCVPDTGNLGQVAASGMWSAAVSWPDR